MNLPLIFTLSIVVLAPLSVVGLGLQNLFGGGSCRCNPRCPPRKVCHRPVIPHCLAGPVCPPPAPLPEPCFLPDPCPPVRYIPPPPPCPPPPPVPVCPEPLPPLPCPAPPPCPPKLPCPPPPPPRICPPPPPPRICPPPTPPRTCPPLPRPRPCSIPRPCPPPIIPRPCARPKPCPPKKICPPPVPVCPIPTSVYPTAPVPKNDCCCCCISPCRFMRKRLLGETIAIREDPRCNSEALRRIMKSNISSDSITSKRAIQAAAERKLKKGKFDVICGTGDFSYIVNTNFFCQETFGNVTCYAFRQLYGPNGSEVI